LLSEDFLQHLVDDWSAPKGFSGARRPGIGADDRPGFARKTPLDRYTVEEWMQEFGFGVAGPTQAEWDELLEEMRSGVSAPKGEKQSDPRADAQASDPDAKSRSRRDTTATDRPESGKPGAPGATDQPNARPPGTLPNDPITRAAMQAWPGRINPDDLNMEQWLEGDERLQEG